jgi:hypothetical protein
LNGRRLRRQLEALQTGRTPFLTDPDGLGKDIETVSAIKNCMAGRLARRPALAKRLTTRDLTGRQAI